MSLHQKLRYIMLSLALPLVLCMFAALGVFVCYAGQYRKVTHNVTIGSSFNLNFTPNMTAAAMAAAGILLIFLPSIRFVSLI